MAISKNTSNIPFQGKNNDGNALGNIASHYRVIVLNESDMSGVVDDGVIYTFPCAAVLERVIVKNTGSTAFAIATTAYIDDGTTHQTADIKTLASGASSFTYVEPVSKAANAQLLWDLGGSNSSASTASAQIIICAWFVDDVES